jgi:tetratricopeptide (TPR) repeat protein
LHGSASRTSILRRKQQFLLLTARGFLGEDSLTKTTHVTPNAEALARCEAALKERDEGDYEGAQDVIRPLWQGIGYRPETVGLHASVAAEVLYSVGVLIGWIGSKNQVTGTQESAKNLITESIAFFESTGDVKKIAEATTEIAYCYWRSGELDEARITLNEALAKLTQRESPGPEHYSN